MSPTDILQQVVASPMKQSDLTREQRKAIIAEHFAEIMKALDLDLDDPSLHGTPNRVAKMYVDEIFRGLWAENFPKIMVIPNDMHADSPVTCRNIKVMSQCEHHFVTIAGRATVSYFPKDKIIGLSKINRLVDYFCRRPQVQERLTKQIADALVTILGTDDVAVHIEAVHYCVVSRGIEDVNSTTATVDLRGRFRDSAMTRSEFFSIVNGR